MQDKTELSKKIEELTALRKSIALDLKVIAKSTNIPTQILKNIELQEFNKLPHDRGTLSMARSSDPNSANSQFFICFKPAPFLDNQYTVFGKVIEGMEFVDKIKRGDENNNGSVSDPDKIISFKSL